MPTSFGDNENDREEEAEGRAEGEEREKQDKEEEKERVEMGRVLHTRGTVAPRHIMLVCWFGENFVLPWISGLAWHTSFSL